MDDPQVVSRDEWLAARRQLLAREKEFTRQRDALNAERRRLPMTEIDKQYAFEGRNGKASLHHLGKVADPQMVLAHPFLLVWVSAHPSSSVRSARTTLARMAC